MSHKPNIGISYAAFRSALSPRERPVYDQRVGGWVIIARPELGVFKKSDGDALDALALERGIALINEETHVTSNCTRRPRR